MTDCLGEDVPMYTYQVDSFSTHSASRGYWLTSTPESNRTCATNNESQADSTAESIKTIDNYGDEIKTLKSHFWQSSENILDVDETETQATPKCYMKTCI